MGFEPTDVLPPSVFKTDAINRTLPALLRMVGEAGFEPATSWFQTRHADQTALLPESSVSMAVSANHFTLCDFCLHCLLSMVPRIP